MQGVRPADADRLPWLEPYRETKKPGRPLPRRGYGKPLALGAGIGLLLAVGAGGYWLGQRGEAPSAPRPSATIALPAARPQPLPVAEAPPPAAQPDVTPTALPAVKKAAPAKKHIKRPSPPRRKIRTAAVQHARLDAVRAAQERRAQIRPWPKMPSPGPAGQVIQLGAFTTAARANEAYRQRVARYKLLAGMPRVVVPVVTKPGGRVLYVLRLGTTSRQQSKTVCRNLRTSGDHCLVIG
jgi:hypothetical protein